jgi:hypothetical protein
LNWSTSFASFTKEPISSIKIEEFNFGTTPQKKSPDMLPQHGKTRDIIAYFHHRNGQRIPVHVRAIAVRNDKGVSGALEIFDEIYEKISFIEELETLRQEVLTDPLTKIGNRRFFDLNIEARFAAYHAEQIPGGATFLTSACSLPLSAPATFGADARSP